MTWRTFLRVAGVALLLALAPPTIAQTGSRFLIAPTTRPDPAGDVLEVAAASGQFTHFLAAVEAAGYAQTLRGPGPFTVFAPTDDAFRRMDRRELARLMQPQQRDELLALLAHHVVPERLTSQSLAGRLTRAEAASGYHVTLDGRDGLRIDDQLVAVPDISAANGVVHGINRVLTPPVLVASH